MTGAGKGLGRAVTLALALEGVNVGLMARTPSQLEEVAEAVKKYGVKAAVVTADVTDMEAVNKAVDDVHQQFSAIDILINNAGVGAFGKFLEMEPAKWESIIQVNLEEPYYITRAVLPQMIERQTGDIMNVSFTAGQKGAPDSF
ncbi:SDR family NAD(P)-dependent oxidoreductase [Pontibacter oryzae]|uniref:SDR family NAD(P)-dependent oxidoreductase n=1 Tax=Pontibacter oryzae TaxID=2304593 RepID=UPI0021CF65D5|nr:SDR family NAD(P)-dependent oxidoreductase [Pontibacter oryzae]